MKIVEGIFGPMAGKLLTLADTDADQAIADLWARERYVPEYPQMRDWTPQEVAAAEEAARLANREWTSGAPGSGGGSADIVPIVTSLVPDTAVLGDADVTMHVMGSAFSVLSVIVFAGNTEQTVFVSPTELTTVVTPSLAWGEVAVPVLVRNGYAESEPLDFTFTAAVGVTETPEA